MRSFSAYKSVLVAAAVACAALLAAAPALAKVGTIWNIQSEAVPTNMQTSDDSGAVIKVAAEGGTFTLSYEGQTTVPIAYDASSATVASALDALSSIGGVGGSATVAGGKEPPAANNYVTSEYPYGVMFEGTLHGASAAAITADGASLTGGFSPEVTVKAAPNDEYDLHVENIGDTASTGKITFVDKLPPGVTTTGTFESWINGGNSGNFVCSPEAGLSEVICTSEESIPAGVSGSYNGGFGTNAGVFAIAIPVKVAADASGNSPMQKRM